MIVVEKLTKTYGETTAVDGISFSVERGEVVGFLGPNGAGKSTTMRIITTYLPPTSGVARIAGHDVVGEPIEVRRRIGYLPENNPLYVDMTTEGYLDYRARLKGLPRNARTRALGEVVDRCGLKGKERTVIGHLSKGYRQRVGLADALVASPPILILDEPTVGLDPNQIKEIRSLIKELGRDRTVILSTHILPEVDAICSRVIIMSGGRIAAMDTIENLRRGGGDRARLRVELAGAPAGAAEALRGVAGVVDVKGEGALFTVEADARAEVRDEIFRLAQAKGWTLRELTQERRSLEDVFQEATTR